MKKIIFIILLCVIAGCESQYDEYDLTGYNLDGYDREGYTIWGYNKKGYNRDGFNREGYNRKGKYNPEYDERLTSLLKSDVSTEQQEELTAQELQEKLIAQEQQLKELKQRQKTIEQKLSIVEILEDPESFTYRDSNIVVTLDKVYVKDGCLYAEMTLMVTRDTVIIRPKTCKKIIHPDGSVIEEIPQGIKMLDNFDNSLGLGNIEPCYYGYDSETGIRPKKSQLFTIRFNNKPLNNTGWLTLEVAKDVFGNIGPFSLRIPRTVIIHLLS